jgi:prepilin-type N-terminal cleavage/methylation domain-containing protein
MMMMTMSITPRALSLSRRRCFTLVELLVVMGVIAVLGIVTTLSYRGIAQDAKLASGKNTVAAVLDNARGLAMRNNRIVVVVFRPRLDGREQYVECVIAQSTGESIVGTTTLNGPPREFVVDRFAPVPGVPARTLPKGVKVSGPGYGTDDDFGWVTQSHLPAINSVGLGEAAGAQVAVMFSPAGNTLTNNSQSDAERAFVDFNHDEAQTFGAAGNAVDYSAIIGGPQYLAMFEQDFETDECYITIAPFLAVFDDDEVRQLSDLTEWGDALTRATDYSAYINSNADRLHFNRYTGVVMK